MLQWPPLPRQPTLLMTLDLLSPWLLPMKLLLPLLPLLPQVQVPRLLRIPRLPRVLQQMPLRRPRLLELVATR